MSAIKPTLEKVISNYEEKGIVKCLFAQFLVFFYLENNSPEQCEDLLTQEHEVVDKWDDCIL